MSDSGGSKPFDLGPKLVSAERALAAIRAGNRIYIGTGCAAPRTLLSRLEAMDPAPVDLEFVSFLTTSALPQVEGACRTHHRHLAFFVGSEMRGLLRVKGAMTMRFLSASGPTSTGLKRLTALLVLRSCIAATPKMITMAPLGRAV